MKKHRLFTTFCVNYHKKARNLYVYGNKLPEYGKLLVYLCPKLY